MAKDVDLSSKEWRDLIFEGKNQDFGAYQMRATSDRRHNKAMIAGVVAIAVLLAIVFGVKSFQAEEADITTDASQELLNAAQAQQEEEAEEEEIVYIEPEEVVIPEEQVLAEQKMTEFIATNDETEEIKTIEERKEDDSAIGKQTVESDNTDLRAESLPQNAIVVEEPVGGEKKEEEVFRAVEQMPVYPGGDAALYKAINDNLRYPPMAAENNIQGQVVVQFVVQKDGTIGKVVVARGVDPDLDKEAVRVVKKLGKFTPGRNNGVPVAVWYTLPIRFKLANM
ncbi:MAG: energy transducer TonB [Muribaculaceae bacterium]|nr:energy transducer TonB [Muribaculaceae bacterium]